MNNKILSFLLIFVLSSSLSVGAFAAGPSSIQEINENYQLEAGLVIDFNDSTVSRNNAEAWAYKDFAKATNSEKVNILKARSIMMQQTDWVADGFKGIYTAPDGTKTEVLTFSEVFPGWNIEQIWAYNNAVRAKSTKQNVMSVSSARASDAYFSANIPAATTTNAPNVYSRYMTSGPDNYTTTVQSLTGSAHCNIGYSFYVKSHGTPYFTHDVGSKINMPVGGSFKISDVTGFYNDKFQIRVSTYSTPGSGTFKLRVD